jgi:mycothiol S-conjugate amidase
VARRLLSVHAHPDDESSKGSATAAYYRSRGAEVLVVSCTGGERGDVQNPALEPLAMAERDMAGLRRLEMDAARAELDIEHRWLGYSDSGLPDEGEKPDPLGFAVIPLEISGPPLVKVIREFRPQVLVTYDEQGGYPHPDHIRTHEVSMWAIEVAADGAALPELGEPWRVSKVYYDRIFNAQRLRAVQEEMTKTMPDSPLLAELTSFRAWLDEREPPTTHVPSGDFFETRDAALRAHASQVPPDSSFFFWPNEIQQRVWPFEDFDLVQSRVNSSIPESDLFAGIEEES